MHIGLIGLGKMGFNLGLNMLDHEISVTGWDIHPDVVEQFAQFGGIPAQTVEALVQSLPSPKTVWLMVPQGSIVDELLEQLAPLLSPGDVVVEAGNSHYKASVARAKRMQALGIFYLDVGTSGGMDGARNGACYMIGGAEAAFKRLEPVFQKTSVINGYLYTGPSGSGHYAKMVHNGIEYGMMAAIGEGFEVLEQSPYPYDFEAVSKLWCNGSVIRGWLLELATQAFAADPNLEQIKGVMHSSGEGKWTVEEALDLNVPTPIIAMSLMMRYRSQTPDSFTGKVVAALRNQFGGHAVEKAHNA